MLVLATDKNSSEIRSSANLGLAAIFEAVLDASKDGIVDASAVSTAFNSCVAKLLECLKGEIRPEVRNCSADALRYMCKSLHQHIIKSIVFVFIYIFTLNWFYIISQGSTTSSL